MRVGIAGQGEFFKRVLDLFRVHFAENELLIVSPDPFEAKNKIDSFSQISFEGRITFLLVDWLKIIPDWALEKWVFVNSHGGMLPGWRGYHGNGWALINGEQQIGLTWHLVNSKLDDGPIIHQQFFPAGPEDTFNQLRKQYNEYYISNVLDVFNGFLSGELEPTPQEPDKAFYVGRRTQRECYLDWTRNSQFLLNFIRFLTPPSAPGAFTVYNGKKLIILEADQERCPEYEEVPGRVLLVDAQKGVLVKTGDTAIWLKKVLYEGQEYEANQLVKGLGERLGIDLIDNELRSLGIY